jgi:hypothetical protein
MVDSFFKYSGDLFDVWLRVVLIMFESVLMYGGLWFDVL